MPPVPVHLMQAIDGPAPDLSPRIKSFFNRIESPIERRFAGALFAVLSDYPAAAFFWPDDKAPHVEYLPNGAHFFSQAQLAGYRIDFVVILKLQSGPRVFAIECDGHDFHERTKEQAASDRSRDRDLTARGITVIRFTGSEIWRDADRCVEELVNIWVGQPVDA